MVKLVGALRLAKVGAVCIPIGIDVFLQILEWKHAGPPSKCCKVCFPCCGKGGLPKGGLDAKVDLNADLDLEAPAEKKESDDAPKKGMQGRAVDAVDGVQKSLYESYGEDAAAIEDRTSALAEDAKQTVSDTVSDTDVPQRLDEELQKAGAQLGERSSAELGALEDAPPQDGRESLAMAKAGLARQLEKADSKAQQAEKEGEEAEKNGEEGEAEGEAEADQRKTGVSAVL